MDDEPRLPALIDRATQALGRARNSAELLEVRKLAQAAELVAKVTGAANEVRADCTRIIALAELRLGRELKQGRERGEVAKRGGDRRSIKPRSAGVDPATLDELGISSQRAAEFQTLAKAGEEVVEKAVAEALAEGQAPTRSKINAAARELVRRKGRTPTELNGTGPKGLPTERYAHFTNEQFGLIRKLGGTLKRIKPIFNGSAAKLAIAVPTPFVKSLSNDATRAAKWLSEFAHTLEERRARSSR